MIFKQNEEYRYIKTAIFDDNSCKIDIDSWTSTNNCTLVLRTCRDIEGSITHIWKDTEVTMGKEDVFDLAMQLLKQFDTM